jgi:glycosyltransferase involved in cell wall biosynthesis
MRCLLVSHSGELAGAERSLVDAIAATPIDAGTELTVALPSLDQGLAQKLAREQPHVRVVQRRVHQWMGRRHLGPIGLVRLVQCFLDVPTLVRFMRSERFDRVVVNTSTMPGPVAAARLLGVLVLVVARESIRDNPILRSIVPKRLMIALLKRWSTGVVSVSRYVDQQWGGGTVVASFTPRDMPAQEDQPRAGEPEVSPEASDGPLQLVMLGTLSSEKGQADAIAAVARVIRAGEEISLTVAGGGPRSYRRYLNDLVQRLDVHDHVAVLEHQSDPRALVGSADVALVCSRNEAFGRVTVEALELGIPVLGYRAGGTAELLSHGGGFLVPPKAEALADKLLDIIRHRSHLVRAREEALRLELTNWRLHQSSDLVRFIVGQS